MQWKRERLGPGLLKRSLRDDQSGIALIYVTFLLPVIIGFALLAVDVGRFMTLNSSLQHGADALALAGAAELDGAPTAIDRSEGAMKQFITQNTALFTSSVATVGWSDVKICYLASIPEEDSEVIADSDCLSTIDNAARAANSLETKFLRVHVNAKNYDTIFPATFIGALTNTAKTSAEAVAGFEAAVCNFTPLFMCNPFETNANKSTSYDDHGLIAFSQDWQSRRKALRFLTVATGKNVPGVPGQYGFLDPVTGNGKKQLGEEIASVSPDLCYVRDKIETKTGDMADLRNAFNTRFDLYFGSYSKRDYPPAQNVRKGYAVAKVNVNNGKLQSNGANACSTNDNKLAENPNAFLGMPVDSCFKNTNCKIGDGNWNWDPDLPNGGSPYDATKDISDVSFTKYWDTNFRTGQSSPASYPTDVDLGLGTTGAQFTNTNPPPRYNVYLYENNKRVGNKLLRDFGTKSNAAKPPGKTVGVDYPATVDGETGNPQCEAAPATTVDRRIIYGAVINCLAEGLTSGGGGYTAFAFGKFFMIRPMQQTTSSDLWLEIVDIVRPGDGTGVARDKVQLYR